MKLLTVANAKTSKGEKLGYLTGILYLAPANESGVMNTCAMSTPGCRAGCLYTAGRAQVFPELIFGSRIRKTQWLARDRAGFLAQLRDDIRALIKRAKRERLIPCVRVNGTSDLPWMAHAMAREFPEVPFYDYTKLPKPWQRTRPNYHLTFSLSESNESAALDALSHGVNVAVVFDVKRGKPLPEMWHGRHVIDGDSHDLRFLDAYRFGLVIGWPKKTCTDSYKKHSCHYRHLRPRHKHGGTMRYNVATHRTAGFESERNDCTVRALKNVTGVPYVDAHDWMRKHGRKNGRGCNLPKYLQDVESARETIYGYRVRMKWRAYYKREVQTLQHALWGLQRGRYILITSSHAIAVIDGVVHDAWEIKAELKALTK